MTSEDIRAVIRSNAAIIHEIHTKLHRNFLQRDANPEEWLKAAEELRARYDLLAFPGGESTMRERLRRNDPEAVESAICFLEVRPYFFRSGYMFKDLLRWSRKLDLTAEQRERLQIVDAAYQTWRENRRRSKVRA